MPLHDCPAERHSWIETLSDNNQAALTQTEYPLLSGTGVLHRIRASIPSGWVSVARRGIFGVSARLPAGLQQRVHRLAGLVSPDMHRIERDYPGWIERFDRIDDQTRDEITEAIGRMADPPLISVLMPVFNPPPDHLLAAIGSVQAQLYRRWELCIADDASTDPTVGSILRRAAESDARIKVIRREQNGHISAASNSALGLATGLFVALLDHDDILPPHALFEVASVIGARGDADIIYSDEDHIDNEGRRSHPYFKPDWNADLMLGQNLISHLGVYRRSLMRQIGGFRVGFEGSQDHDLALRMVAETTADRIIHIPKVLYHWRQGAGDRTFSEAAQARCIVNGRRAIQTFVNRLQPVAKVEPAPFVATWTRVVYPVPDPQPLVSVIVSGLGGKVGLGDWMTRVLDLTHYAALELLVADETTPLPGDAVADPRVRRIAGPGSPLRNAVDAARGDLLLFLDPALEPRGATWLSEMVSQAVRPDIGAVGAKLLSPQGTILHAGMVVGGRGIAFTPFVGRRRTQIGYFGHLQLTRNVTAVSGGCLLVRRRSYLAAGGFDDSLSPVFGDVDLCLKLGRASLRNLWTPYAELYRRAGSLLGTAIDSASYEREAAHMRERWGQLLAIDPHWNPNLRPDPHEMILACPPRTMPDGTLRAA